MATDETTVSIISAIVAAIALAIREAAAGIVRAIKGNTRAQQKKAEAEEDARHEEAAREAAKDALKREQELADRETARILKAIDELGAKVQRGNVLAHENRERLVKVESQHEAANEQRKRLEQWTQNITEDMRVIKQRSTGKVE